MVAIIMITALIKVITAIAVRLAAIIAVVVRLFDHQLQDNIKAIIAMIMARKPCYQYFLC